MYIITVPTSIDIHLMPDLSALSEASEMIGGILSSGDVVIFESTVYPGCMEEFCFPILESASGLTHNEDFFTGYSPGRISAGDKTHKTPDIVKITSGSNKETADFVDSLYRLVITAGTHQVDSIRVAEAAAIIGNTQRDVNIALVNELAIIFDKLGINTEEVLRAAESKSDFLPFRPGLVGGHSVSVDPYYLAHKAFEVSYHPQVILSGRRINDSMGCHVADSVVKLMMKKRLNVVDSKILVMGLAFKENCPDQRNTRVVDIIEELNTYHATVEVYDPWVDVETAAEEYGITMIDLPDPDTYDAIILCVGHKEFKAMGEAKIRTLGKPGHVLYDAKYVLDKSEADGRL
ncbi:MAG: Vi polysaccharide biosynthesis protein VipA/TviB [Moraxellaceae bacterium]|nr:MAG: Vi polysaccharide biosynthesis protein VipA/TviB [Moraxellaceae bacterium]